jgi:hypothetical protein
MVMIYYCFHLVGFLFVYPAATAVLLGNSSARFAAPLGLHLSKAVSMASS